MWLPSSRYKFFYILSICVVINQILKYDQTIFAIAQRLPSGLAQQPPLADHAVPRLWRDRIFLSLSNYKMPCMRNLGSRISHAW